MLVERAKEEGDETIAIVPLEGDIDGRMATMLQMKGRLMGLYAALGAILLVAVALVALFWKPGGIIGEPAVKRQVVAPLLLTPYHSLPPRFDRRQDRHTRGDYGASVHRSGNGASFWLVEWRLFSANTDVRRRRY